MNSVHFSSHSNEWATPTDLFRVLDWEIGFTLDPCATEHNAKRKKFFTKEEDGLAQSWANETGFKNAPSGREIRLNWGRMEFGESSNNASFPSAVVVFRPGNHRCLLRAF